jgi:hypothetical protein
LHVMLRVRLHIQNLSAASTILFVLHAMSSPALSRLAPPRAPPGRQIADGEADQRQRAIDQQGGQPRGGRCLPCLADADHRQHGRRRRRQRVANAVEDLADKGGHTDGARHSECQMLANGRPARRGGRHGWGCHLVGWDRQPRLVIPCLVSGVSAVLAEEPAEAGCLRADPGVTTRSVQNRTLSWSAGCDVTYCTRNCPLTRGCKVAKRAEPSSSAGHVDPGLVILRDLLAALATTAKNTTVGMTISVAHQG